MTRRVAVTFDLPEDNSPQRFREMLDDGEDVDAVLFYLVNHGEEVKEIEVDTVVVFRS